uniref:EGF-like domain-containing protein n=1 Tax=Plectus sambesii TaxID=2011161 RepID=A0A914WBD6_9BILA
AKDAKATCLDLINRFACVCGPGFTGPLCRIGPRVIAQAQGLVKPGGPLSRVAGEGAQNNTLAVATGVIDAVAYLTSLLSTDDRVALSWTLDEMIDWCTYEEKPCDMKGHFTSFNDPTMGNCYTFNSINSTRDFKAFKAGEQGGLAMMMKVDQSQYASWTDIAGIRVFFHDKREIVYPESVSITVTPGTASSAIISRTETFRMSAPYGICTDDTSEVPSYYYKGPYMKEGCMRSCYQDNMQRVCGCMNPAYPIPKDRLSCTLNSSKCIHQFNKDYSDPDQWNCSCPLSCKQVDYLAGASRTRFRNNPAQCSAQNNVTLRNSCEDMFQNSRILINVYYSNIISIRFEEKELYPIMNALSDTGGNIGLLYGVSVVTVVEFAFTIAMAIFHGTTNTML